MLLRLIGKWLNAGVLEDGCVTHPGSRLAQGGVVSPMLSNVYLHDVLDDWFEREVKPRLKGRSFLIRYADDFVMGFRCEEDARRVMDVLPKRFGKYGLTLHPEKTRLVPFQRPPDRPQRPGDRKAGTPRDIRLPGVHPLLGPRSKGNWVVKRKTAKSRFSRGLKAVAEWCRTNDISDGGPAPDTEAEASRALRVLRDHRQRGCVGDSGGRQLWKKWLAAAQHGRCTGSGSAGCWSGYPLPPAIVVHSSTSRSESSLK